MATTDVNCLGVTGIGGGELFKEKTADECVKHNEKSRQSESQWGTTIGAGSGSDRNDNYVDFLEITH